jgi:hypothetical protein
LGDEVWFVVARDWPRYEVDSRRYVGLADVAQSGAGVLSFNLPRTHGISLTVELADAES